MTLPDCAGRNGPRSIERNAGVPLDASLDPGPYLVEPEATALVELVMRWPDVLPRALRMREPCVIVQFLFALAQGMATAHAKLRVKDCGHEATARARLLLFHVARVTLANGLRILGLDPLEQM